VSPPQSRAADCSTARPKYAVKIMCTHQAVLGTPCSIHGPNARGGEFEQMAIGVAKVEAPAAQFPGAFLFHGDPLLLEPGLPICQFCGWDGERQMQFSISVVRCRRRE